jgi:nucleotide-binding universal stress UspA family protein
LLRTGTSFDAVVQKERAKGIDIRELAQEGNPTEIILAVANKERIDLLIMTTHEEGRLEHLLFGHSNDEIIRRLPCSLFLVKREPAVFGAVY